MELTEEYLLKNGWKPNCEYVGAMDGMKETEYIKEINGKTYSVNIGLFSPSIGITRDGCCTFFAWGLTVERLIILEEGLK